MNTTSVTSPATSGPARPRPAAPDLASVIELLKPITWFAPMWAYLCGAVSSGVPFAEHWGGVVLGMVLAGPVVCGLSQAANDWCDRHVDAINEPDRPIPSGRVPGRWGLWIALGMTAPAFVIGAWLGPWALAATALAVALAWAYSAPPLRLKTSGWWGPAAVGGCYEGLPWFTGAAAMAGGFPPGPVLALAALYSIGAHGIMTLNDFKAIEGDRATGVGSLPVRLGPERAARVACWTMAIPQAVVVALLLFWDRPIYACVVAALLLAQIGLMRRLLTDPKAHAPWYNATGTSLYVLGMLASAFAVRSLGG